jgi:hypothetical protein
MRPVALKSATSGASWGAMASERATASAMRTRTGIANVRNGGVMTVHALARANASRKPFSQAVETVKVIGSRSRVDQ